MAVRKVRTPAGERKYGQPIGSIIVADSVLRSLKVTGTPFKGWTRVKGTNGKEYDIGHDSDAGVWVALEPDTWDVVADEGDSEEEIFELLDKAVRKRGSNPTPEDPVIGTAVNKPPSAVKPAPKKKTPAKKATTKKAPAKKVVSKKPKMPATKKPPAGKPIKDMTAPEKRAEAGRIAREGRAAAKKSTTAKKTTKKPTKRFMHEHEHFGERSRGTTVVQTHEGWFTRSHTGRVSKNGTLYHHIRQHDSHEAAVAYAKAKQGIKDEPKESAPTPRGKPYKSNMKVSEADYNTIRDAIAKYDSEELRERYRKGDFPRSENVKNKDKRYRWDLYYYAARMEGGLPDSTNGYDMNAMDTVLRNIVPPLGESTKPDSKPNATKPTTAEMRDVNKLPYERQVETYLERRKIGATHDEAMRAARNLIELEQGEPEYGTGDSDWSAPGQSPGSTGYEGLSDAELTKAIRDTKWMINNLEKDIPPKATKKFLATRRESVKQERERLRLMQAEQRERRGANQPSKKATQARKRSESPDRSAPENSQKVKASDLQQGDTLIIQGTPQQRVELTGVRTIKGKVRAVGTGPDMIEVSYASPSGGETRRYRADTDLYVVDKARLLTGSDVDYGTWSDDSLRKMLASQSLKPTRRKKMEAELRRRANQRDLEREIRPESKPSLESILFDLRGKPIGNAEYEKFSHVTNAELGQWQSTLRKRITQLRSYMQSRAVSSPEYKRWEAERREAEKVIRQINAVLAIRRSA